MTTKQVDKTKNTDTYKKDNTDQDNSATKYINKNKTSWSDLIDRAWYQFDTKVGTKKLIKDLSYIFISPIIAMIVVNPANYIIGLIVIYLNIIVLDYILDLHNFSVFYSLLILSISIFIIKPDIVIFWLIFYIMYNIIKNKSSNYLG